MCRLSKSIGWLLDLISQDQAFSIECLHAPKNASPKYGREVGHVQKNSCFTESIRTPNNTSTFEKRQEDCISWYTDPF